MHRLIEEHLEEILSGAALPASHPAREHLKSCEECSEEVSAFEEHAALFRSLRAPAETAREPQPGFYARVRERIEAQKPVSIWDVFASSVFGRGLAAASLALVVLMGAFLFTAEAGPQALATRGVVTETYPMLPDSDFPDEVFAMPAMARYSAADTNRGAVLVNLATYRER